MTQVHFPGRRGLLAAATLIALIALAGGAFYLRSSSADTQPVAAQPRVTPVPVATVE